MSRLLAANDRAELQSPAADRLVGYMDAMLGERILEVAVAQSEAEIDPEGLLEDAAASVAVTRLNSAGAGATAEDLAFAA
jgi:hypothetical protein